MQLQGESSPKQINFIASLFSQRKIPADLFEAVQNVAAGTVEIDKQRASEMIGFLLDLPKKTSAVKAAQVEAEGIYVINGTTIIKMKKSKVGRLYAMILVEIGGRRLTEIGEVVNFDWQYAPHLTGTVTADQKMTLEQAKVFGIRYGVCMRCGLALKDAKSVERAIGPVCAKYFA